MGAFTLNILPFSPSLPLPRIMESHISIWTWISRSSDLEVHSRDQFSRKNNGGGNDAAVLSNLEEDPIVLVQYPLLYYHLLSTTFHE